MQINLDWLADFVEVPPLSELCDKLAAAGIEVEEVGDPAAGWAGIVVGEVTQVEPLGGAETLQVCTVYDGTGAHQVVCGAANVSCGIKVAWAQPGARVSGSTIAVRSVRGVTSYGMLCSRAELGLEAKSTGILHLPPTAMLGAALATQWVVAPTLVVAAAANRPDLLSHLGIAREVAAFTGKRLKSAKWRVTEKGPDSGTLARVVVDDAAGCKRYCARVVRGVVVGPSPQWLRERLERVGVRSINNVVDVTNYVLMELGQPLHAFDLARVGPEAGIPTLHVRRAKAGERLTTLDGVERVLDDEDLVIADNARALALAGIMGGADSGVSDTTTNLVVESAFFDPMRVRRTSRRLGLRSEASHRFERGADVGMAFKAVERCAQLLAEVAGGDVAKGVLEVAQKSEPLREITLRLERLPRLLGIHMPAETAAQLLEPLEIRCLTRNESSLRFQVPSFRQDITREIDLVEELVRRHGYERVPERLPDTGADYTFEPIFDHGVTGLRQALLLQGLSEVVTFGFGNPVHYELAAERDGAAVRILNPLGEDMSALRTTLLPGLMSVLAHNQRHGLRHVRVFEIGTTMQARTAAAHEDERERDLPHEEQRLGILLCGGRDAGRWYERGGLVDFADLAGVVDNILDIFNRGSASTRVAAAAKGFNPHCAAQVLLDGQVVGVMGQLHPDYTRQWGVEGAVYAAELSLDAAGRQAVRAVGYQPTARFPGTRRDVAVVADRATAAAVVQRFLEENAGGALGRQVVEKVRLFDVYQGEPIPKTHVSLAFSIDYRASERTLTDAEVGAAFDSLLEKLRSHFGFEVRGVG